MIFNSFEFIVFFIAVVVLYFSIPGKWRWVLLLAASYYFYMAWKAEYVLLIMASTAVDYIMGLQMSKRASKKERKPFLILSVVSNLALLFSFKYFNFFSDSTRTILDSLNVMAEVPYFDVLLPVGISFYTFQTLSYSIDVYNGKTKAEKHLGIFALYVSFFPQLVAGPIERSSRLLPQFYKTYTFDYQRVTDGMKLMAWGFFKKVVIADRLAEYVDIVYNNPSAEYLFSSHYILATIFFAFQIYCDFSGYSDIAIGAAKIMGFELMENFRTPYFSKSISEFWNRWHISLSTWFRDYVYIPLGGNRVVKWKWYYNLIITFLLSGLWHGANWTFVIWGAIHGSYLVIGIWTKSMQQKLLNHLGLSTGSFLTRSINAGITFALVCFAWIFFRAESLGDALLITRNIAIFDYHNIHFSLGDFGASELITSVCLIIFMEVIHYSERTTRFIPLLNKQPLVIRWAFYYALIGMIMLLGTFSKQEFIYFQF